MSTSVTPPRSTPAGRGKVRSFFAYLFLPHGKPGEIVIISHSSLFYWWPVWLVGFIMAGLTWWNGYRLAVVPPHTKPMKNAHIVPPRADGKQPKPITRDVLVL